MSRAVGELIGVFLKVHPSAYAWQSWWLLTSHGPIGELLVVKWPEFNVYEHASPEHGGVAAIIFLILLSIFYSVTDVFLNCSVCVK